MSISKHRSLVSCLGLLAGLAACDAVERVTNEPCQKAACEAADKPAGGAGTGIAGVVAEMSDTGTPGCFPCVWGQGRLDIWQTDARITTKGDAEALIDTRGPTTSLLVDRQYTQALAPGHYLVCALPGACAGVTVAAGAVTTVNVLTGHRPFGLVLFEGGARQPDERVFYTLRRPPTN